jgi:hypothetical protein
MKTLVVYDSVYGNTESIARAIGDAVGGEVEVLRGCGPILASMCRSTGAYATAEPHLPLRCPG